MHKTVLPKLPSKYCHFERPPRGHATTRMGSPAALRTAGERVAPQRLCVRCLAAKQSAKAAGPSKGGPPQGADASAQGSRKRSGEPLLWATGVTKSNDGDRVQFEELQFTLEKGARWAVVGPNGSGKSTLLRALAGVDTDLSAGAVTRRKGLRVGWLPQEPQLKLDRPVLDAVFDADAPALRLVARFERAAAAAAAGDSASAALLDDLTREMDAAGAWGVKAEVRVVLDKLGCTPFLDRTVGDLSGGQRKRVALATSLLSSPDVLILDEPTNHLSLEGVEWLEGCLRDAQRSLTLVMVSHDRAFLDAVCTDLLELDGSGGYWFHSGGYSRYLAGREERYHAQAAAAAGAVTLLRRETVWMAKQPKARLAKSQSRQDAFYELQDAAAAVPERMGTIDAAAAAVMAPRLGDIIVELHDASLSLGTTRVLHKFTHLFRRGERVGLVGANGAGKSSFLGVCTGRLAVDSGTVTIGETVRFGHYTQLFEFPDPSQRVADYVAQLGADARELVKRLQAGASGATLAGWSTDDLMDRFQFMKGRQAVPIGKLSGGERRRLQLLTVLSTLPNFLLLDEISNDLDLDTIEAIEAMLAGFSGVILIAGHDRAFLDALVQHIFVFNGDGDIRDFHGNYSQLRASQSSGGGVGGGAGAAAPAAAGTPARDAAPDARRAASNASKKLPKIEAELSKLDVLLAELDEQLVQAASDAGLCGKLATQRQALVDQQEALFQQYADLDALSRAAG